ncbi:hypothetical protein HAX54_004174 [Datura stramonium]|uniref:Uncharacterized protein n=1 Tax=Datura stramonium TaxID=4076 RepID=A0ABS8RVY8_DATST|nr:hypothetical protein [Datura stramonium]
MEWERVKDSFDDTLFIPTESSTPQEIMIDEEISTLMDKPQTFHDHNYYCGNEEKELNVQEESLSLKVENGILQALENSYHDKMVMGTNFEVISNEEEVKMDLKSQGDRSPIQSSIDITVATLQGADITLKKDA